jgi:hypothetical protein
MKLLGTALTGIFFVSLIGMGVVLADKGALFSCGGIIAWLLASIICFLTVSIICTPLLLLLGLFDVIIKRVFK